MKLFLIVLIIVFISFQICSAQYELIQVQIVTRHGARSPYQLYPGDPTVWNCDLHAYGSVGNQQDNSTLGPGQRRYVRSYIPGRQILKGTCPQGKLTKQGQAQHVKLGGQVRQQYQGFLPDQFNPKQLYIRSSDVPRTIESAASFFTGLYPEEKPTSELINIWLIEAEADDIQPVDSCSKLNQLCNQAQQVKEWVDIAEAMYPIQKLLNTELGVPFEYSSFTPGLRNNLECRRFHNVTIPSVITPEIQDVIESVAVYQLGKLYNNTTRTPLLIGRFLRELYENIQDATNVHTKTNSIREPRFSLFSAHDTTLGSLLGSLRSWQDVWPRFASHLHLEVYTNGNNEYFVRGMYNDKVIRFGQCAEYCPLSEFGDIISDSIVDQQQYTTECDSVGNVSGINQYTNFLC